MGILGAVERRDGYVTAVTELTGPLHPKFPQIHEIPTCPWEGLESEDQRPTPLTPSSSVILGLNGDLTNTD